MKRKVYNELQNWKEKSARKVALMIDGARRVGKSYIVRQFAENEYESYIFIDFTTAKNGIKRLFTDYIDTLDDFFLHLSVETGVKLHEHKSLIVFDEVQTFPIARQAIKQLVADGRYDYIETGSLVSINQNVKDINIPSEEHHIMMHPMDLEEFIWALGDDMIMDFVRKCFEERKPLGQSLHRKMMDYLRLYMIVGGMPQAVAEWVGSRDFNAVDAVKRDILSLYRMDIMKYAKRNKAKVTKIFDTIPSQLQRHERRFHLADLQSGARLRDWETAFFWLNESRVVNICYAATEPNVGLSMRMDESAMKLYMADTGLLVSHAFSEVAINTETLYQKLLHDKLEINKGMLVENLVAQMLVSSGRSLYFFSSYSKEDASLRMEIDFLIPKSLISSRHNIHPVEVKSSTRYTYSSLTKFTNKYDVFCAEPIILHSGDLCQKDNILFLPLYMAGLL